MTAGSINVPDILAQATVLHGVDGPNRLKPIGFKGHTSNFWSTVREVINGATITVPGDDFYVSDYGAVGDGVTDDHQAIQDAIDAAEAAGGGCVLFDARTYGVSDVPSVNDDYVRLVGKGIGITTIKTIGAVTPTSVVNVGGGGHTSTITHCGVSGITFDANSKAVLGLEIFNVWHGRFHDIEVKNATSHGLKTSSSTAASNSQVWDCQFVSCYATDNGGDGFCLQALRECIGSMMFSRNSGARGFAFLPYIEGSDPSLHGVTAHNNFNMLVAQDNTGDAFVIDGATRSSWSQLLGEDNGGVGLRLTSSYAATNGAPGPNSIRVSDLTLRYNDGGGIEQDEDSYLNRAHFSNVAIAGQTGGPDDLTGVHLRGATYIQFDNLSVFNMSGTAVQIEDGAQPNGTIWAATESGWIQFTNLRLLTNGTAGSSVAHGLSLEDSTRNVTVTNAVLRNSQTTGSNYEFNVEAGVTNFRVLGCDVDPNGGVGSCWNIGSGAEDEVQVVAFRYASNNYVPTVASAAGITIPPVAPGGVVLVTGTTTVNTITPMQDGTSVCFLTNGALTFAHGAGGTGQILFVGGASVSLASNRIVRLTCRGTVWYGEQ